MAGEDGSHGSHGWIKDIAEQTGDVFYAIQTDPEMAVEFMSDTILGQTGYSAEEFLSDPELLFRIVEPKDAWYLRAAMHAEPGLALDMELRWIHRDGRRVWTQNWGRRRVRDDGSAVLEGTSHDITALRNAESELNLQREHYRLLAERSADFTLRVSTDNVVEWVSPSVTRILGWNSEELIGRSGFDFIHPADVPGTRENAARMRTGESRSGRIRVLRSDGSYLWVSQVSTPVLDHDGELVARISGFQNIDAQMRAEWALARSERRFRLAMESAPTGMAVLDLERRFVQVNLALCRMLGRAQDWLVGRYIRDVVYAADEEADIRMRQAVLAGQVESARHPTRLLRADGQQVWAEHSVGLLRDEDGQPLSYVSQFMDVTETRRAQERLRFLASHDALTELANRHTLLAQLEHDLGAVGGGGHAPQLAVLFVDLDNFKHINDSLGHGIGDEVLISVARCLARSVRPGDVVARIGGDEFIVALPGVTSADEADAVADRIHQSLSHEIDTAAGQVVVSASIGVSVAEPNESPDDVLRRADIALYRAKRDGRSRTAIFDAGIDG